MTPSAPEDPNETPPPRPVVIFDRDRDRQVPAPDSRIPYRPFDGWLKCQRPAHRNDLGDLVASTAFPLFVADPDALSAEDEHYLNQNDEYREAGFEVEETGPVLFRRFAGDERGELSLDRGRYYTVCTSSVGADHGTLANEFNSYMNVHETGFVLAADRAEAPVPESAVSIFLSNVPGAPSTPLHKAGQAGLLPADKPHVRVDIPYDVSQASIEKVLDLRYPDARQWLFDEFGSGKRDVLERSFGDALPGESFINMLPSLMIRDNGGDDVSNVIGVYLRKIGVEALIFPSARSDVFAEFEHGQLLDFGGWNLVDYRNASSDPRLPKVLTFTGWVPFRDSSKMRHFDYTTTIRFPPEGTIFDGSFRVEGNQSHHLLFLHIQLCFKIWDELGVDHAVQWYRWHSTRGHNDGGRWTATSRCLTCDDERLIETIEELHAIPAACPECGAFLASLP